jgi:hypothetical protein
LSVAALVLRCSTIVLWARPLQLCARWQLYKFATS